MTVQPHPVDVLDRAACGLPDVPYVHPFSVSPLAVWPADVADGPHGLCAHSLQPLFPYGSFGATPEALALATEHAVDPMHLLMLHTRGIWGDVPAEDAGENDYSVTRQLRIMSAYPVCWHEDTQDASVLWLITEADRSSTTLLRPEDY